VLVLITILNMGGLLRKRRNAPDSGGLKERLLDGEGVSDGEHETSYQATTRLGGNKTVLQQTLHFFTYLVGKVAGYIIPSTWFLEKVKLTELQRRRVSELRARAGVKYDQETHGGDLKKLWELAFPETTPFVEGKTKQWQEMGWQSDHPSSDFRGGGYLALENLIYFADQKPLAFQRLCFKTQGQRSDWEYPFGAAGVNITFMLTKMLELNAKDASSSSSSEFSPVTPAGRAFLALLNVEGERHDRAFEELFCAVFELLDRVWLEEKADYMQFPTVMKKTEERLTKTMAKQPQNMQHLEDLLLMSG